MAMRRALALLSVWAFVALSGACGSKDDTAPYELRDNARVAPEALSERAIVEQDAIRLPRGGSDEALGWAPGDVVVGRRSKDPNGGNPLGFLRRVERVEIVGDEIVVHTARATLEEAFVKLELDGKTEEDPSKPGPKAAALPPQLAPSDVSASLADGKFTLRYDEVWTFTGATRTARGEWSAGAAGLARAEAHLKAAIDFNPRYQLSLHNWELVGLVEGTLHGVVTGSFTLSGTVAGFTRYQLPYKLSKPLFFTAFGVPVEATLEVTAAIRCDARADAEASILYGTDVAINNARFGVICKAGQSCRVVKQHDDPIWTPIGPSMRLEGGITAKCQLEPRVALYLYDAIGPYAEVSPYVKASFRAPPCKITATTGLDVTVGLRGRIPIVRQPWFDTHRTFNLVDIPLYDGPLGNCNGSTAGILGGGGEEAPGVVRMSDDDAKQPANVVMDAEFLYWTDNGSGPPWKDGRVLKRSKRDASPPVVLASNRRRPTKLALDGTHVYWVETGPIDEPLEGGELLKIEKNAPPGSSPTVLRRKLTRPVAIAVDDERVFFTEGNAAPLGTLSSVKKDGSDPRRLVHGLAQPLAIALDGDDVFVVETGNVANGSIDRVSKGGYEGSTPAGSGRFEVVTADVHDPIGVVVDGDFVYWAELADESNGVLKRWSKSSKKIDVLASGLAFPYALASDSTRVFVTTADAIVRVPKSGGDVLHVLRGLHSPLSLLVQTDASRRASHVLWTSLGDPTTTLPVGGLYAYGFREMP